MVMLRSVFTHGPPGPRPRAANFQGWHIKTIETEVWYAEKKGCPRERSTLKTMLVPSFFVTTLLALEGAEAIAYWLPA